MIWLDRQWRRAGDNADRIAVVFLLLGLTLGVFSGILGIHSVHWDGQVNGACVIDLEAVGSGAPCPDIRKQVGFLWAPNWSLGAFLLLPFIISNLLAARSGVEPLMKELVTSGMLRRRDQGPLAVEDVLPMWERESRFFLALALGICVPMTLLFVMYDDFIAVVFDWLWNNPSTDEIIARIKASGSTEFRSSEYEFDWSIAALFNDVDVSHHANIAFSLAAYLLIPTFGAGLVLVGFVWFIALSAFFSDKYLKKHGLILVPDLQSVDSRLGFERFAPVMDHLVRAAVATAILAVLMHLQNVFLRVEQSETIVDLVFGDVLGALLKVSEDIALKPLLDVLKPTPEALGIPYSSISKQTYISAVVFLLIGYIVILSLWLTIAKRADEGRDYIDESLDDEAKKKMADFRIWPLEWISINRLLVSFALLFMCMYFVNLIAFVIMAAFVNLMASMWPWNQKGVSRKGAGSRDRDEA